MAGFTLNKPRFIANKIGKPEGKHSKHQIESDFIINRPITQNYL